MQKLSLQAKAARRYRVTTDSHHNKSVAPRLLKRNFLPKTVNQVWTGDITYLWTDEGWQYLAVFLDLYSRKVVGWSMAKR